ncbi:MAG: phage portal protein [Anaerolineales bacterium]|nr:phage portal protein [Anaerolineales bacterium]MCW5855296.1 phage portal protein [Anaerolineales bacterium]
MGIFDKLGLGLGSVLGNVAGGAVGAYRQAVGAPAKATVPGPALVSGDRERAMPSLAVAYNQQDLYQRLAWVSMAISAVAQQAAGGLFNVVQLEGEEARDIPNHPYELLHRRPNPLWAGFEFWRAFFSYQLLTGNAYAWLNKAHATAPIQEMWLVPSHKIQPVPDGRQGIRGYKYDPGGGAPVVYLDPWEVLHTREFHSMNMYVGLSRISQLAIVAQGDLAMQKHNTSYFHDQGGRVPGLLAFPDPIGDEEWAELKAQVKQADKEQRMMMLRNVGVGGVNWVATSMTRKDMEFLAGREANQEEIFNWLAPGLNSWLAVNSTEANSKSGRDAFYELSVWPLHKLLGEKVTSQLLPSYGKNLLGNFEDVRPRDTELRLREQLAYERTHTVDEVRKKYYSEAPLPGGRGGQLARDMGGDLERLDTNTALPAEKAVRRPGAEKEREQFRRYAQKRLEEGKPEKVGEFRFETLDEAEQTELKAEVLGGDWALKQRLQDLIDEVREDA